jgi:hypothetical protein
VLEAKSGTIRRGEGLPQLYFGEIIKPEVPLLANTQGPERMELLTERMIGIALETKDKVEVSEGNCGCDCRCCQRSCR